jgi:hypothetical protein
MVFSIKNGIKLIVWNFLLLSLSFWIDHPIVPKHPYMPQCCLIFSHHKLLHGFETELHSRKYSYKTMQPIHYNRDYAEQPERRQ